MNTSYERTKSTTCEWYTPKEIVDALGEFDLEQCEHLGSALSSIEMILKSLKS